MIDMFILAEVLGKYDPRGVLCLASILCLFIVALAYSKGAIAGSGTCATLCIICALATTEPENAVDGVFVNAVANNPRSFIANISQTKWMEKPGGAALDKGNASFIILDQGTSLVSDNVLVFIPDEEIMIVDGWKRMKPDGREIHSYDIARPEILEDRDWSNPNGWVYGERYGNWGHPDNYLYKKDGVLVKVNTGKPPIDDDYYIWNKPFDPKNVAKAYGGGGVPTWLYHPAAPIWIFGFFGIGAFIGGAIIKSKL